MTDFHNDDDCYEAFNQPLRMFCGYGEDAYEAVISTVRLAQRERDKYPLGDLLSITLEWCDDGDYYSVSVVTS